MESFEHFWGIRWIIYWVEGYIFECSSELVGEFLLSVRLTHHRNGQVFAITSVYVPCIEGRTTDFWQEFWGTRGWETGPRLIGGDFNVIRCFGERTPWYSYPENVRIQRSYPISLPHRASISWSFLYMTSDWQPPTSAKLDRFFFASNRRSSTPILQFVLYPAFFLTISQFCSTLKIFHETFNL